MRHFPWIASVILFGALELSAAEPVDFERDVQPVLTRFGCNAGACHGKQRGQNGFQLSLLGFDADFDHAALTQEVRGRRIVLTRPDESLLLRKATGLLPHGGGRRIDPEGTEYELLKRWVSEGAVREVAGTPTIDHITVDPEQHRFTTEESIPLKVIAHYSDQSIRDVTQLAAYQSNESPVVTVDETGTLQPGGVTGEAAVVVRYANHFAIVQTSVPLAGSVADDYYTKLPQSNFIDGHIWDGLQRLGLTASEPAPEHRFLRRVYLDVIGRMPTAEEARDYLNDAATDKREQLVDRLLASPEYAEHWANKWADLLRPNPYHVGIKATLNYDAWIRDSFRKNVPYDQFVRELITARGSTFRQGNTTLFRDRRTPDELTTIVSQLFLGIRLECAKCHHHPFEVYGQEDFYSFAAYFAKLGRKGTGISAPISGSEEFIFAGDKGTVKHPLTEEVLEPKPLFGAATDVSKVDDPREVLADWITSPDNKFFAQTMANRIWADLMGRGLVEPVDDLRATNPPINAPLLTALGDDFAKNGFDIKQLIRRIVLSEAYRLSSQPTERNIVDTRAYSRHYRQRLRAEVLFDSITRITGVAQDFEAMPPESNAREIWTHRIDSQFLDAYGRPDPNQDPPCERMTDPTVVQTLHLMNSEELYTRIASDKGTAAALAGSDKTPEQIVDELYLAIYARRPTVDESRVAVDLFSEEGVDRRKLTEDIMWALINTPEFVFKD